MLLRTVKIDIEKNTGGVVLSQIVQNLLKLLEYSYNTCEPEEEDAFTSIWKVTDIVSKDYNELLDELVLKDGLNELKENNLISDYELEIEVS